MDTNNLKEYFFYVFEDTFSEHRGVYLEPGSSLLETLEGISAEEASIRVGGKCGSLAAQVAHVTFYMENTEHFIRTGEDKPADFTQIWRTVEKVNAEEWQQLKDALRTAYARLHALLQSADWQWMHVAGAFNILVHSAYHLGEIRQALCTLR